MIPAFSFDQEVSGDQAKQDRISLLVNHRHLRALPEDIEAFTFHLGGPGKEMADAGTVFSALFNSRQIRGGQHVLDIRGSSRGAKTSDAPPLFSGSYRCSRFSSTATTEVDVFTDLHLFLNPTRFLRYQNLETSSRTGGSPLSSTFFKRPLPDWRGELSLDGKDNWIPDAPHSSAICIVQGSGSG